MERKDFIKACGFACLGGSFALSLLEGCVTANHFGQTTLRDNELVVSKSEFLKSAQGEKKTYRKYIVLKNEKLDYPILLHRISEDSYKALIMICTHKSCELQLQGDFLICPCHGSEFDNMGVVQNPPAQDNLKMFTTKSDNENIYIAI